MDREERDEKAPQFHRRCALITRKEHRARPGPRLSPKVGPPWLDRDGFNWEARQGDVPIVSRVRGRWPQYVRSARTRLQANPMGRPEGPNLYPEIATATPILLSNRVTRTTRPSHWRRTGRPGDARSSTMTKLICSPGANDWSVSKKTPERLTSRVMPSPRDYRAPSLTPSVARRLQSPPVSAIRDGHWFHHLRL